MSGFLIKRWEGSNEGDCIRRLQCAPYKSPGHFATVQFVLDVGEMQNVSLQQQHEKSPSYGSLYINFAK